MTKTVASKTGTRDEALENARRLLATDPYAAAEQARELLTADAHDGDALRLLGAALRRLGRTEAAETAEREAIQASAYNPLLVEAANAIAGGRPADAEYLLRPYLARVPDDAAAHLMLAQIAADVGASDQAEQLLRRALELAPAYAEAWLLLARVRADCGALASALETLDESPGPCRSSVRALRLKAALQGRLGDYAAASATHERILARTPTVTDWVAYGHLLRTIGRRADSVAAYRRALAIDPHSGEAYWSLTNLKTEAISDADLGAMERAARAGGKPDSQVHLHFALGKALEDRKDFAAAFAHYDKGNRLRRQSLPYDRAEVDAAVQAARSYAAAISPPEGALRDDPIFIVGMPRSGSTLLEQILASHSLVEGTSELPYIAALSRADIDPARDAATQLRFLGEEYLRLAGRHRKTDRPYFIDKQPNNWMHIGFIRAILPNARIIDMRRHPLASCMANFRQHFGQGQAFSYALEDFCHYHRSYIELIDIDRSARPGSVYTLLYEELVTDIEGQVRKILDHLNLPFEAACLNFHMNDRAVRTPSSEQVRRPIYADAMEDWRSFVPWLTPAQRLLEREIARYPWRSSKAG